MNRPSQNILRNYSEELATKIKNAKKNNCYNTEPFKHLVIDDFLPSELAEICLKNFPNPDSDEACWDISNDKDIEIKYRSTWKSEFDIPEGIVDAVRLLNSSVFMLSIAEIFGIHKLIPDPYFSGGGLNITKPDGLLDVHVDGNYHDATGLNRRMNAILYLNPGWQKDWGGEFGIYDDNGENCIKKVAPLFNRLVVFDTHDKSFHGLPNPLNFPEGQCRRSIILYYYTVAPREDHNNVYDKPHSALWKKRNFKDKRGDVERKYL